MILACFKKIIRFNLIISIQIFKVFFINFLMIKSVENINLQVT